MKVDAIVLMAAVAAVGPAVAGQRAPLLPEKDMGALANELSGETAKRNLARAWRGCTGSARGSSGFHAAAELVAERARA